MGQRLVSQVLVTAAQMQAIEQRLFDAGLPVAALMEKVAGLIFQRVRQLVPNLTPISVLVGSGHNGGDALVVARELHLAGYPVVLLSPVGNHRELTSQHLRYALSLGIPLETDWAVWLDRAPIIVDGLFGFGLNRNLTEPLTTLIDQINQADKTIISIDLPSGLGADTGAILGAALRAKHTLCLGLWKLGLCQDQALEYLGKPELLDFGIPEADIVAVLGERPPVRRLTTSLALANLPLPRPALTHKYQQGHLLLVCGSRRYGGAAVLAGVGARASGVGMLSIVCPQSLQALLWQHLPEALVIPCPETAAGAIARLPDLAWDSYTAIACGCGLTTEAPVLAQIIPAVAPVILDADGLNLLAKDTQQLQLRPGSTILTPHAGEFRRLFPELVGCDRLQASQTAARISGAIILLKGSRTIIADPTGQTYIVPESSPALARGGSGDVLTGLIGGLVAQAPLAPLGTVAAAAWWHAQAGMAAAQATTELGVDPLTLAENLQPTLHQFLVQEVVRAKRTGQPIFTRT